MTRWCWASPTEARHVVVQVTADPEVAQRRIAQLQVRVSAPAALSGQHADGRRDLGLADAGRPGQVHFGGPFRALAPDHGSIQIELAQIPADRGLDQVFTGVHLLAHGDVPRILAAGEVQIIDVADFAVDHIAVAIDQPDFQRVVAAGQVQVADLVAAQRGRPLPHQAAIAVELVVALGRGIEHQRAGVALTAQIVLAADGDKTVEAGRQNGADRARRVVDAVLLARAHIGAGEVLCR